MTIIDDNDKTKYLVLSEQYLRYVMSEYGFKLVKINPDSKKMQKLKRELRFEEKHQSRSLMPDFTAMTIARIKAEIILEQDNCKQFKKI